MGVSDFPIVLTLIVFFSGLAASFWVAWNFGGLQRPGSAVAKPQKPLFRWRIILSEIWRNAKFPVRRVPVLVITLASLLCISPGNQPEEWQEPKKTQTSFFLPLVFSDGNQYASMEAEIRFAQFGRRTNCNWVGWNDGIVRAVCFGARRAKVVVMDVLQPDDSGCSTVPFPDGRTFRFERTLQGQWQRCN